MNTLKKYFSTSSIALTGLIFLLIVSWFYIYKNQQTSNEDVHRWLQEQFQVVVSDYVEKKYPAIKQITFHKIFTQKTSQPTQIKIFFSYSLDIEDEASGELSIEGEAFLTQKDSNKNWLLSEFKVTNSLLEFSEPFVIKASP